MLCYLVNVYSACSMSGKRRTWEELRGLKSEFARGDWCVAGDFNAVCEGQKGRAIRLTLIKPK